MNRFFFSIPEEKKNPFYKPKIVREVIIDEKKRHKMDLCEKCHFYGKYCFYVSEQEMNSRPFVPKNNQN